MRFVEQSIRGSGPVLDISCGGGVLAAALQERGIAVCASEISCPPLRRIHRATGIPSACCRLPDICFLPRSFSTILAFHVLEHLPDPYAGLEALRETTKPGGNLVIQVPNADCWQALMLSEYWNGFDVPRHPVSFRQQDIESFLELCGYEIERRKLFSLADNPAGLATSLCPWLDPIVRRVRRVRESRHLALLKSTLYAALAAAATPFTLLEAASGAGSTIMIAARRKGERNDRILGAGSRLSPWGE